MAEKLKKERAQVRRIVTRHALQEELSDVDYEYLKEKTEQLNVLDRAIQQLLLETEDETVLEKEYDECENYQKKWLELKRKLKTAENQKNKEDNAKHNLKLPKLEIRKFDDNPKTWLGFWGQFRKIHEDKDMDAEDKYQYLLQAMTPESRARSIVESYPPTKENYEKVIEDLKSRFGKEDILIEIYVRELLQLVVSKHDLSVDVLYDKIIANLQILESLGIGRDKYECFLLPLIESSLPESSLLLWSKHTLGDGSKLSQLLLFLKNEVDAVTRVQLAKTDFVGISSSTKHYQQEAVSTAACLVSKQVSEKHITCLFCDKQHSTSECGKAQNFTLEERRDAIKKKGGCYICLKKGHLARYCKTFVKCMYCSKRHAVLMCPDIKSKQNEKTSEQVKPKIKEKEPEVANNFTSNNTTTLLQTVIIKISGNTKEKKVRALLDSGSQRTYIKADLVNELGLQATGSESLGHALFGGVKKAPQIHKLLKFTVRNLDNTYQTTMIGLEQEILCGTLPKVQDPNLIENLQKNNIKLTDTKEDIAEISILIGSDYLGSLLEGNIVHINENLVAIPTRLGWTLQGPIQGIYNTTVSSHFISTMNEENSLEFLWNIETLGIKDPYEKENKADILNQFYDTVSVNKEGRYEVELLWKDCQRVEPGYEQAQKRLWSTTRRLECIEKLEDYHEVLQEWISEGIIEKVDKSAKEEGHYLPHHAVVKMQSTTTKIRPVFDASSIDKNKNSLNTCIEKGPNLMELIPKLLIIFRAGTYGVISDIKKAFLQIAVSPPDRKYLKLLWWNDPYTKEEVITYQHARVPFGVACSPFLLAATISHHLEKNTDTYPETAKRLKESFYVDNCVTSFDTEQEVKKFEKEASSLMEKGKFDLRGWMTNSNKNVEPVSVLGMQWDRYGDSLSCNINIKSLPDNTTKRKLLSTAQNIFDPLGLLSPATLIPKLIIQKAWQLKTGWDEKIPTELEKEYRDWIGHINCINQCKIQRRLSLTSLQHCDVTIHVFCDASKDAYAGCVFLRTEHEGQVTVQLVIAKSRVAPIKRQMSLPRLELMGAVIASRLYKEVSQSGLLSQCKNYKVYCWTDSTVVLAWLQRQDTWKTFVTNRVKEICMNTNKKDWRHLPGVQNPADLPSRGCNAKTLLESRWWTGPRWLYLKEDYWPKSAAPEKENEKEIIASEMNKSTAVHVEVNTENFSSHLLYFSQYKKIVRLVARLLRMNPKFKKEYNVSSEHIGYEEYSNAEETLIKLIQKETYQEMKNKYKNLITIEENNILKVKTRLDYSGEDRNFIYPILLPGSHEIIYRMTVELHKELKHTGTQILMATIRSKYWVTGIRRLTKRVVSQCIICKRYKAKHYEAPQPPLPADRICSTATFETTGIDLAGPLILKGGQKCWIVLFTCAVYRAVHFEITDTLSAADFMKALRRFIARRGRPRTIYTDNGTNFTGTANLLKEVNWNIIEEATSTYNIRWKFSVPAAPWWGGWWERLIRIIKDMLKRILGKASIDSVELSTVLCDCEAVINNRPLTYVDTEEAKPLTPNMFLQNLPNCDTPDFDQIDRRELNIRHKYLQKLREEFRLRFKSEYIGLLKSKGGKKEKELRIGDIVLIDTDTKRLNWPLGIIVEIYQGKDGQTRVAKLKTASGEKVRPCQRLYPLEISAASQEWQSSVPTSPRADVSATAPDSPAQSGDIDNGQDNVTPLPHSVATTRTGRVIKLPARFFD